MFDSILRFLAGDWLNLWVIFVWLFVSLGLMRDGLRGRHGDAPMTRGDREFWINELATRDVATGEAETSSLLVAIGSTWSRLSGAACIGCGVGALVALVLALAGSLRLTDSLHLLTDFNVFAPYALAIVFGSAGYVLGLSYGALQLRRRNRGLPHYGDLRPRRLSTYRPLRIPVALTILVALYAVEAIVAFPHLPSTIKIATPSNPLLLPRSPLLIIIPIAASAVTILVMEVLASRVVDLPRLVSGLEPEIGVKLDDALRTRIVRKLEGAETFVLGALGVILWLLLHQASGSPLVRVIMSVGLAVPMLICLLGILSRQGSSGSAPFSNWCVRRVDPDG